MHSKTINNLKALAADLYQETCGISGDDADEWLEAYALAMQDIVSTGADYSEDLVINNFQWIQRRKTRA
ncbi:MAG: hypothetical protein KJO69_07725 [Gammaproteobacteria bacterium]|nr:hypothetical protein [Gammaproteobacteria bacterium]